MPRLDREHDRALLRRPAALQRPVARRLTALMVRHLSLKSPVPALCEQGLDRALVADDLPWRTDQKSCHNETRCQQQKETFHRTINHLPQEGQATKACSRTSDLRLQVQSGSSPGSRSRAAFNRLKEHLAHPTPAGRPKRGANPSSMAKTSVRRTVRTR